MNLISDITALLKPLRLSGILELLEVRNKEAIANKISYIEFLAILLQDELLRRENKQFEARFKKSGIHCNKTLEQFDFTFNKKINQQQIKHLAACQFITAKEPVLIVGPCGTGKSHVAHALGHCAIRLGYDVLFFTQTQLFKYMQTARATGIYDKQFRILIKIPLLIIDDFGLKPLRSPQDEDFHDLISERYEQAATIVTSNLAFSEWGDAFPNKLLGAATIDRLCHAAHRVVLDGNSYRSKTDNTNRNQG